MFSRKLRALGFQRPTTFSVTDELELRRLVSWLEDMKIRCYKIEEREPLRQTDSASWNDAFFKYLTDLGCPSELLSAADDRITVIDWLLGYAVRLEYADNAEKYTHGAVQQRSSVSKFESIDFSGPEFRAGLQSILQVLQLPPHPDSLVLLQAISNYVGHKLTPEAVDAARAESAEKTQRTMEIDLNEVALGFATGDRTLDHAAKILRLLHISELRELQTKINEAIVSVQLITANPKTDTKLGKVGV